MEIWANCLPTLNKLINFSYSIIIMTLWSACTLNDAEWCQSNNFFSDRDSKFGHYTLAFVIVIICLILHLWHRQTATSKNNYWIFWKFPIKNRIQLNAEKYACCSYSTLWLIYHTIAITNGKVQCPNFKSRSMKNWLLWLILNSLFSLILLLCLSIHWLDNKIGPKNLLKFNRPQKFRKGNVTCMRFVYSLAKTWIFIKFGVSSSISFEFRTCVCLCFVWAMLISFFSKWWWFIVYHYDIMKIINLQLYIYFYMLVLTLNYGKICIRELTFQIADFDINKT